MSDTVMVGLDPTISGQFGLGSQEMVGSGPTMTHKGNTQ
jgi:hypothetical protein